jgi:hypothetical protein
MSKKIGLAVMGIALCVGTAQASTFASGSYVLRLVVEQTCTIRHTPGLTELGAGSYGLGGIKEYCNAPGGYDVVVSYSPGTMQGAVISLGGDSVTLNGSGTATISHAPGPRIRDRELVATPGANGFDTNVLNIEAVAN